MLEHRVIPLADLSRVARVGDELRAGEGEVAVGAQLELGEAVLACQWFMIILAGLAGVLLRTFEAIRAEVFFPVWSKERNLQFSSFSVF